MKILKHFKLYYHKILYFRSYYHFIYWCLKKNLNCVFFRFTTKLLENSKAFLARSNLDWVLIHHKIPFLSVLINTISLSCFVLRGWHKKIPFSRTFSTLFVIAAEIYIMFLAVLLVSWPGTNSIRLIHFRSSHRRCFVKKVFLQISHISRKNICVGVSL